MQAPDHFQIKAADWRATIARNQRKTFIVIGLFIAIYLALGFLIDLYIHGAFIPGQFPLVLSNFLNFTTPPTITLIMGVVAMVSLLITYTLYDKLMLLGTEYHEITPETAQTLEEKQLYNVVEEVKIAASMRYMPKVYLIEADYMNAFASGYSEKSAMVAITRGLMQKLDRSELQAVMAHELSHIRHGDIKLTLTASVLSNLILIVLDILFYSVVFSGRRDRDRTNRFATIVILARYLLPLITVILMLFLSRTREYMADAGSVELLRSNQPLANALLKIEHDHENNVDAYRQAYGQTKHEDIRRAAYIFDPFEAGIHPVKSLGSSLFSTHPSTEDRLKALGYN